MRVILLENVKKIGKKHEVKNVADGYAQNMLFPRKLAVLATPQALAEIEKLKQTASASQAQQEASATAMIKSLDGETVTIVQKKNQKGGLYKALTAGDIASIISEEKGVNLIPEMVLLDKSIKEGGDHSIALKAYGQKGTVILTV